ncbi:MAG: hypothetical protein Q9163_001186 [Psora crenata]
MALTIASLVCLILVGLGGTNKNNSTYNNLYFFRANTSDINVDASIVDIPLPDGINLPGDVANNSGGAVKSALDIKDFYRVSLWNYCSGDFTSNSTGGVSESVTFCSPRRNEFWFNPVEVWGLNSTGVERFFGDELRSGLNTYKTVAKWMFICYLVAVIATVVEILVGFLALFSRLGSLITTIVSTVSSLFVFAFALTATILYSTLAGAFNTALNKYNVHGSLGRNIYVAAWLGVAFSLGAGLFWLFSSCCCSGRSDRIKGYTDGGKPSGPGFMGRTPYNYERMGSPVRGGMPYNEAQKGYGMGNINQQKQTAYEPFRHTGGNMA